MQGGLRVLDQGFRRAAIAGMQRDADADADVDHLPVYQERLVERRQQALGHGPGLARRAAKRLDHRELVAAKPRHRVAVPRGHHQPVADGDQQLVPGGMADQLVERPEAVHVDAEQRHALALAVRQRKRLFQPVAEQAAAGQACQRVVMRQVQRRVVRAGAGGEARIGLLAPQLGGGAAQGDQAAEAGQQHCRRNNEQEARDGGVGQAAQQRGHRGRSMKTCPECPRKEITKRYRIAT